MHYKALYTLGVYPELDSVLSTINAYGSMGTGMNALNARSLRYGHMPLATYCPKPW